MSQSPYAGPPDQRASLRRMNFLVVLLVVSNIATGVFSVYLLRKVDARYSELIAQSVPALNDLRELMTDTVAAMGATNLRYFDGATAKPAEALQSARQRLATVQRFRGEMLRAHDFHEAPQDRAAIVKHGEEFERAAAELSRLYAAGNTAEARQFREEKLLPVFDQLVATIGSAADHLEQQSLTTSKDYTSKTRGLTAFVLGVAGWPLIVLVGLLLLTAIFVVVLMFLFRGKELGDMP